MIQLLFGNERYSHGYFLPPGVGRCVSVPGPPADKAGGDISTADYTSL